MTINKEQSEYMDAVSRELGDAMSPYEELTLLGFDMNSFYGNRRGVPADNRINLADNPDEEYDFEDDEDIEGVVDEEYEFEDENEEYSMLSGILKLNNDKRKYFA